MIGDTQTGFQQDGYTPSATGDGSYTGGSGSASDPYQLDNFTFTGGNSSGGNSGSNSSSGNSGSNSSSGNSGSSFLDSLMAGIVGFKTTNTAAGYINGTASLPAPTSPAVGTSGNSNGNIVIILLILAALFAAYFLFFKK
jgi:hypothetical protein